MYKCTECQSTFNNKPQFCDCGNDTFQEIFGQYDNCNSFSDNEDEIIKPVEPVQTKMIASLIFFIISIVVSVALLIFAFAKESSKEHSKITQEYKAKQLTMNANLPNIDALWDNTPPNNNPMSGGGVMSRKTINSRMPNIDLATKRYIIDLGKAFLSEWNRSEITGNGICQVQFYVDKAGVIQNPTFIKRSNNKTLDDSITNMLSKVKRYYPPPEFYKGELIIIAFEVSKGEFRIYYPNN